MHKSVQAVLILALLFGLTAGRSSFSGSLTLDEARLRVERVQGRDKVRIEGYELIDDPGVPELPLGTMLLCLPPGTRVESVRITSVDERPLDGVYDVAPAQPPRILSASPEAPVGPNPEVYGSDTPYPGEVLVHVRDGIMGGIPVASFLYYPVGYQPGSGRLVLREHVEFELDLAAQAKPSGNGPAVPNPVSAEILRAQVLNPEAVPDVTFDLSAEMPYLIVTDSSLVDEFQPLADWKTKKGLPARIRTMDWIDGRYTGVDLAEKLRTYLKVCYADSGLGWVLLGGDVNFVPDRVAYAMTCEAGLHWDEDSLRADLYYSDLDGTWDADSDGIFGEVEDSVDLFPDVLVGRASCETASEVANFVAKTLDYERSPADDYLTDLLYLGEILWQTPFTDGSVTKEMIDTPDRFDVERLYESLGNESEASVIAAINEGKALINHVGHGWTGTLSVGNGNLHNDDMDNLTNGQRQGALFSVGCWSGAFHYDAISEHYLSNPNGGGIAFIGMTSYGWGSPGNPGYGHSERFDRYFCDQVLNAETPRLGSALAAVKAQIAPYARTENVHRWHEYQTNLLGDPELVLWTDSLAALDVHHPDSVPLGESPYSVVVMKDGAGLENALVCLSKGNEVYERACTGPSGQADFTVNTVSQGPMDVTVTASRALPYEGTTQVFGAGAWLVYADHDVEDLDHGNGDGLVSPGDTVRMPVWIANSGNENASYVRARISTNDPYVTIFDDMEYYGSIYAGETGVTSGFDFYVSEDAPNGHSIDFELDIYIWFTIYWEPHFSDVVCAPVLSYGGSEAEFVPDPGDTVSLELEIWNSGLGPAPGTQVELVSLSPWIGFPSGNLLDFGLVPPDSAGGGTVEISVQPGCPEPHFADLGLLISTSDGYAFTDTLPFFVGDVGFHEGAESGASGWTFEGPWHITDHRSRSGQYAFYCGTEGTYVYEPYVHASLTSPELTLGPNACLTFWQWNELATYGVDGMFVEVRHGGIWDTLDMIASGGGLLTIGNDWVMELHDLSYIPAGDTVQLRFTFISDSTDSAEGFYLDNILIGTDGEMNFHPEPFALLSPEDGDTAFSGSFVDWEDAVDPNPGDEVLYTLYVSQGPELVGPMVYDSLPSSEHTFSVLECETLYTWTVRAYDEHQAVRWASDTFTFYTPGERIDLSALEYAVDDDGGDGDRLLSPGETALLDVTVANHGWGTALGTGGVLISHSPYVQVLESNGTFGDVRGGGTNTTWTPFTIHVDGSCPNGELILLSLELSASPDYVDEDSFYVVVGEPGFSSDLQDSSGWTHISLTAGYHDEWHHSSERFLSPVKSFKCGRPGNTYSAHDDALLATPTFLLEPGSELTFFHWIEAETSGQYPGFCFDAGLVMLKLGDADWQVIEPVGGYPYEILDGYEHPFEELSGYSGHWPEFREAVFDLPDIGGPARIGFRFGTDRGYNLEGWYVDDVSVPAPLVPDIDLDLWTLETEVSPFDPVSLFLTVSNVGDSVLQATARVVDTTAGTGNASQRGRDIPWIQAIPDSFSVPPDSSVVVEVLIDPPETVAEDTFLFDIRIESDDPTEPWLAVPLAVIVHATLCGDANGDGQVTTTDGFYVLNYLGGGPAPVSCWSANVNGEGGISTADGYHLLEYLGSVGSLNCAPCEFLRERGPNPRLKAPGSEGSAQKE
jgi:hypothetical protein